MADNKLMTHGEAKALLDGMTPGPWNARENAYGTWFVNGGPWLPMPAGGEYQALVAGGNSHNTLTGANARAIASLPDILKALIASIEREGRLTEELERVKGHWEALDRILAETHIENDQPDRVKWEGKWHYGPAATAMNSMMRSLKKLCAVALASATLKESSNG